MRRPYWDSTIFSFVGLTLPSQRLCHCRVVAIIRIITEKFRFGRKLQRHGLTSSHRLSRTEDDEEAPKCTQEVTLCACTQPFGAGAGDNCSNNLKQGKCR